MKGIKMIYIYEGKVVKTVTNQEGEITREDTGKKLDQEKCVLPFNFLCSRQGEDIVQIDKEGNIIPGDCYLILPQQIIFEKEYKADGFFNGKHIFEILGEGDEEKGKSILSEKDNESYPRLLMEKNYYKQPFEYLAPSTLTDKFAIRDEEKEKEYLDKVMALLK